MKRAVLLIIIVAFSSVSLQAQSNRARMLESVAEVTANNMFLSWLSIQSLYENVRRGECSPVQFKTVKESISESIQASHSNLRDLETRFELSNIDYEHIDKVEEIYINMDKSLDLLDKYFKSKKESDHERFFESYEEIYYKIKELYKIKNGEEIGR
ncbi:MAG: hypothetical protein ACLFQX_05965 [Candidatus Kapaibacterium sp.]